MDGDEAGRIAILEETLRLEPVVGALYRRTSQELELEDVGATHRLAAGTLVAIDLRATNVDAAVVGEQPLRLDPDRRSSAKVGGAGLSFGDGAHRCPGAAVALQETAIFSTGCCARQESGLNARPTWPGAR